MINSLKYIVVHVTTQKISLPMVEWANVFAAIDLLILEFKGMYYGIPKHEMDNYSLLAFDTSARVKFNPRRARTDPIVSFDVGRLPVIPSVLITEAFLSSTKLAYDLSEFRKRNTEADSQAKPNP
jgi:hypothetical protein